MAKKAKKKATKKVSKKSAAKGRKKFVKKSVKKSPAKKKAKAVVRKKPATFSEKVSGAYHTVVDSVTGTNELRNKMSKPGDSETE
jgi:hypothetical protein